VIEARENITMELNGGDVIVDIDNITLVQVGATLDSLCGATESHVWQKRDV